jgi:hypothetical protein
MQSFVVHQGAWTGSLPETLLAAWCVGAQQEDAARDLVVPLLQAHDDERGLFELAFEQLAARLDRDMLDALSDREYDRALHLARHLSGPLFDRFWAQERAKALVEEIPGRRDDFQTRTLPSETQWGAMRQSMPPAAQIVFLAERLRLIHAKQYDIPGGIDWTDDQFDVPDALLPPWDAPRPEFDRHRVINPYVELRRMDIAADEVVSLLPWLASEDHILAYDLPRFMPHYPRTLHRVRWLVGSIVDAVLGDDATDREVLEGPDAAAKERHVAALAKRAEEQASRRESDRRAEELRTATDDDLLQRALGRLGALDPARAARVLLERARAEPPRRPEWVRLAYALDAPEAADLAAGFVEDADGATAFWAAALLLRHGKEAIRARGLERVLASLDGGDPHARIDVVLDDLLATQDPRARALLSRYLRADRDPSHAPTPLVLQRALLAGEEQAFARLLDGLEGRGGLPLRTYDQEGDGGWSSDGIRDGDHLASRILLWTSGSWSRTKDDAESKARTRAEAAAALRVAFDAAKAGTPPALEPEERPRPLGKWGWASSGWVLRTR